MDCTVHCGLWCTLLTFCSNGALEGLATAAVLAELVVSDCRSLNGSGGGSENATCRCQ